MEEGNPTILFIEDDEDDVFLIQRACKLGEVTHSREFLPNGQAGVEYFSRARERNLPRLIFLDLNMPMMGGLQFLGWLRAQPALKKVPVLVLTTSENPTDVKSAQEAGANAYIVKPSSISEFGTMLKCATEFWLRYNRLNQDPM